MWVWAPSRRLPVCHERRYVKEYFLLCCVTATDAILLRSCISAALLKQFEQERDHFLGPRELRSPSVPVIGADGNLIGGTHFERTECPQGLSGSRAYTMGPSDQAQNSVASPVAWGKIPRDTPSPGSVDDLPESRTVRPSYINVRMRACLLRNVVLKVSGRYLLKSQPLASKLRSLNISSS